MNQTKNQMACAAPVAARRQVTCRALPLKNHRRALKFSSGQVAGLPRCLPRKSQATLSHSVGKKYFGSRGAVWLRLDFHSCVQE